VKVIRVTRAEAVARARHIASLRKTVYKLGAGGRDPWAAEPWTERDGVVGSDCIGFVMWCLGSDRLRQDVKTGTIASYGGWVNTDSAIGDARGARQLFEVTDKPRPGDVIVYPSIYEGGKRKRVGHIGLIVDVTFDVSNWTSNLWKRPASERKNFLRHIKVIDCAAALTRRVLGRAVKETDGNGGWNKPDAVFLRYRDLLE
jgi:hypothetical protein